MDTKGYIWIRVNGKRKREHRVIAEKILGRPLLPTEEVHHIDGNRANNNPGNLMVFDSKGKHSAHHHAEKRSEKK